MSVAAKYLPGWGWKVRAQQRCRLQLLACKISPTCFVRIEDVPHRVPPVGYMPVPYLCNPAQRVSPNRHRVTARQAQTGPLPSTQGILCVPSAQRELRVLGPPLGCAHLLSSGQATGASPIQVHRSTLMGSRGSPVVHGSAWRELHGLLSRCSNHHACPWLHATCQGNQSILHHSRLGSYAGWLPVPLHWRRCTDRLTLPLVGHLHRTAQRKSGPAA